MPFLGTHRTLMTISRGPLEPRPTTKLAPGQTVMELLPGGWRAAAAGLVVASMAPNRLEKRGWCGGGRPELRSAPASPCELCWWRG